MKLSHLIASVATIFASFSEGHSKAPDAINSISNIQDVTINTKNGRVHHLSHFDITFSLHDRRQLYKLELTPNHDILAEDAHVQYLDVQGRIKHSKPIARHEHKVYKGSVWLRDDGREWNKAGWARIYLKKDGDKPLFEGTFSIRGDHHHIQKKSTYFQTRREMDVDVEVGDEDSMIVYRDSDMAPQQRSELKREESESPSCGSDDLAFNADPSNSIFRTRDIDSNTNWGAMLSTKKRQSGNIGTGDLRASIGDTSGCPTELRVAMIGIATDCTYTAAFGSDQAVQENLVSVVNSASDLYESTFNITIGLRNLTISDPECPTTAQDAAQWNLPCTSTADIEDRLDLFSSWRGGLDGGNDGNAWWTLMSTCASGRSVGLAWLGQLCVSSLTGYGGQSVSGANVVVRTAGEWQVFAHESAHTFGAVHDCDSSSCQSSGSSSSSGCCPISTTSCNANGQYLMSPVSETGLTEFSPCTIGNICSGIGRNRVRSSCLTDNRDISTINGAQCGNGIVEAGEECDCGSEEECGSNSCCNPQTCRFTDNSVCDDANDVCCSSCQYRSAGTVCRPGVSECDREETCTGDSGTCPTDSYFPNGQSCGNSSGLTCASGQCTSRDLQCQSVTNPMTSQNFTQACDSSSCTITCASSGQSNLCSSLDQNFIDGTPCSGSGLCGNGRCQSENDSDDDGNLNGSGSGGSGSGGSFFDNNRTLVIGLAAGLGSLVVLLLACCFISSCRSRRRKKQLASMPPPPMMGQYYGNPHLPAYHGPPPNYPGAAHMGYSQRGSVPLVRYA